MAQGKLTTSQVEHLAQLAQLTLTSQERQKLQKQLSEILDYVGQLNKLKTAEVEPTSQVTGLENVFRQDEPSPSLSQKEVLSEAKETKNSFFKVKAVFER